MAKVEEIATPVDDLTQGKAVIFNFAQVKK